MEIKRAITLIISSVLFIGQPVMAKKNKCPFSEIEMPKGMAPTPLFDSATTKSIFDALEVQKGVGRFFELPANPGSIYLEGADFPFDTVDQHARKSVEFWRNPSTRAINYFNSENVDWATYAELVASADILWNELKDCNQNNGTLLRMNFFLGSLCQNEGAGKELLEKIQALNGNMVNYLMTSPLINGVSNETKTKRREVTLLQEFGQGKISGEEYVHNPQRYGDKNHLVNIPNQHPLLQQLMLNLSAMTTNLAIEKRRDIDKITTQVAFGNLDIETASIIKLTFNLFAFTSSKMNDCTELGLWPAMNRVFHFLGPASYNTINTPFFTESEKLAQMSESVCGTKIDLQFGGGTYSRLGFFHIIQMRRLFALYFKDDGKNKDLKTLRKETKLVSPEVLRCE